MFNEQGFCEKPVQKMIDQMIWNGTRNQKNHKDLEENGKLSFEWIQ